MQQDEYGRTTGFGGLVGRSPAMRELFEHIRCVAPHFRTALVSGETGTGKELVASALHRFSPASAGPFVVCNCAAVVETLFETELFGHVKGAFTGALSDRAGFFEQAHGGTLFLDEVGDMPLTTQVKLLRVLQDRHVQRVGGASSRHVDVRVVAATNRDVRKLIQQGQFREDLYYRLSMVEIRVPRLSDRTGDLTLLIDYFLALFAAQYSRIAPRLSRQVQTLFARYCWPGNVRELENVLGSACMVSDGGVIELEDLPKYLRSNETEGSLREPVLDGRELVPLAELERRYTKAILAHVGHNKARAAKILGISRPTLYRLLLDASETGAPRAKRTAVGVCSC